MLFLSLHFLSPSIPEEDLQQIFKTILEARTRITFEESQNKFLKVCSPDVYCKKSYMEYYNFCQECEDFFIIARAKDIN